MNKLPAWIFILLFVGMLHFSATALCQNPPSTVEKSFSSSECVEKSAQPTPNKLSPNDRTNLQLKAKQADSRLTRANRPPTITIPTKRSRTANAPVKVHTNTLTIEEQICAIKAKLEVAPTDSPERNHYLKLLKELED